MGVETGNKEGGVGSQGGGKPEDPCAPNMERGGDCEIKRYRTGWTASRVTDLWLYGHRQKHPVALREKADVAGSIVPSVSLCQKQKMEENHQCINLAHLRHPVLQGLTTRAKYPDQNPTRTDLRPDVVWLVSEGAPTTL